MTTIKPHKLFSFHTEPRCPRCEYVGFDDWWHVLRDRRGSLYPGGKLQCGSCEKTFFIEGVPGNVTSSAFGLSKLDHGLRALGL